MVSRKTGKPYHVDTLHYDGVEHSATQDKDGGTVKKKHKWGRVKTYGGKLCENGDQAISRDVFLNGAFEADDLGFDIWGLFHDELATEVDDTMFGLTIHDLIACQSAVPEWAPGLLLGAEGYEDIIYHK
jgi:DNA polymerase